MKTYISPSLEVAEVNCVDTVLLANSPANSKPTNDNAANQFAKEFDFEEDEEDLDW